MKIKTRYVDFILLSYNVITLAYLLIIAFYNRPTIDDFLYISSTRHDSLWDSVLFFYNNINGRILPNILTYVVFIVYKYIPNLLFVSLFMFIGLYWIMHRILRKKSTRQYSSLTQLQIFNLLCFFITSFIIYNFEMNTYTWTIACIIYFGNIFFALLLFYCVSDNYCSKIKTGLIITSALYIGCSNESFSIIINVLLILYLINACVKAGTVKILKQHQNQKIILAVVFISMSFCVMYLAPANEIRLSTLVRTKLPISEILPATLKSYFLLAKFLILKIPLLLLFTAVFSYSTYHTDLKSSFSFTGKNILIIFFFLWLSILPTTYAIAYTPFRVLTPVWFFMILISLVIATKIKWNYLFIPITSIFFLFAGLAYKLYIEIPVAIKYSQASDERKKILLQNNLKVNPSTLAVDSLPNIGLLRYSGLLVYSAGKYADMRNISFYLAMPEFDNPFIYGIYRNEEISADIDNWKNVQLQDALDLKFKVILKIK